MGQREAFVVYSNLDAVNAQRELDARMAASELTPDRYKWLLMQVGHSEDDADRMAAQYALSVLRAQSGRMGF
jgi:hypothetical protein